MERLAAEFRQTRRKSYQSRGRWNRPGPTGRKGQTLWAKIVKVLRSVYRAYLDLKSKFERLQADYGREVSKNSSLSERIYEVCAERDSLKGKVRDYERVRRAIGPEQADRILEAAYQQEQAEKERKRPQGKNKGRCAIITKNGGCSSECPPVLFGESGKIISCFFRAHYDILLLS